MSTSTTQAINFTAKLALFDGHWQPRAIAQTDDYQFKLIKIGGGFVWHSHANTDETFIVLAGRLRIDFRDDTVHLSPDEMYVVPCGVGHRPFAEGKMRMLLMEPCGVRNTGDQDDGWTAVNDLWI